MTNQSQQSQRALKQQYREQNAALVKAALHTEQIATVAVLRDRTGLSVVTVNKILRDLLESGEILPGEITTSGGGRPAKTYRFNALHRLLLLVTCFRRGGSEIAGYSVHDLFGECLERREELLSAVPSTHTEEFRQGISVYQKRFPRLAMIGMCMPSERIGGRMAAVLRRDPFSQKLALTMEKWFGVPLFFETDINAATLGCFKRHPEHDFVAGVVLVPGRAPSCGFCHHGEVLRGRNGLAGEVRYFPMYENQGVLPSDPQAADDLAVRTLRAVSCVLNPGLVVVYAESIRKGLDQRLRHQLTSPGEQALQPQIEQNVQMREDIISGMLDLSLRRLRQDLKGTSHAA